MSDSGRCSERGTSSYRGSVCGRSGRIKPRKFTGNIYENKKEVKFFPPGHRQPQQVTYSTVKDFVVHNIQDIYSSLLNIDIIGLLPDNPHRVLSKTSDTTLAKIGHMGLDIEFLEELSRFKIKNKT